MYRGYLALAGVELTNTSRLIAHARPDIPQSMEEALAQCACRADFVSYDDSWPGMPAFLGDGPYLITNAPWYDPAMPQSAEFLGYWVTSTEGFGATPVDRAVNDAICAGGVAGPHRDTHRTVRVEALIIACTNAGAQYGLEWLDCRMRPAKALSGTTLEYLAAHPENSAADPQMLRRTMNRVVLTREVSVTKTSNRRNVENRQGSIFNVDWEFAVMDPYTYGPASVEAVVWDSTVVEGIEWAHQPDCDDPAACDTIPVLTSATCVPATVDVRAIQPPVCSGCTPICEVETRVTQIPAAAGMLCTDQAVTLTVTAGAEVFSGNFWFRPCGSTDACDRTGFLSIAGLKPGETVVADSVSGRPYGIIGGQQVRQVGVVSTPSGAPWTATVLDRTQCWELVAQHEPGADYTVSVQVRGRA